MSSLDVPGAHLHYETCGNGPLLLLIPGAPGTGAVFATLAASLSDRFTVVTYDRRGFSRSYLDGAQDYSHRLQTDADDARRLIEHLSDEPATVFGSSSGAVVALQLLTDHPDVVRTAVPYEPSAMRLLPGGGQGATRLLPPPLRPVSRVGTCACTGGLPRDFFPECDHPVMGRPADPETAPQLTANASYWFERELGPYTELLLDTAVLTGHADRVVPAVGRSSRGFPTYEIGLALGDLLGRTAVELPGGHTGYITHTTEFANQLLTALN